MIKYTYKDKTYRSAYQVRQAIWEAERKVFTKVPAENEAEFWEALGVTFTVEEVPFASIKNNKQEELERSFNEWYKDGAVLTSSLGFKIDADQKAMLDVTGLVTLGQNATFMDADNIAHELTLDQLKVLQQEIILAAGQYYQQKWVMRDAIASALTQEDLDNVVIKFKEVSFGE